VPEGVQVRKVPTSMLVPLWIGALSCIWFGLNTDLTITASQAAAEGLLAGTSGMR
jgi:multicomponent Na+:H+ antiporter subunit D